MQKDLIVPVYIDTNALLDLLASIEGGFSIVEKVTTRAAVMSNSNKSVTADAGTEFGIPNVLSLLKINLRGALDSSRQKETGEEKESERYHTYGSLLYRLRTYLGGHKLIKCPGEHGTWECIKPSDFIEISGIFRPNPLADTLERIDRLMGFLEILGPLDANSTSKGRSKTSSSGDKQMKQIRQFLKGILTDIERGNTKTFVIDTLDPLQFSTVVLLFADYLRDQTLTEISHKEYRLLGKVVRKVEPNTEEVIDLLRGTGLGGIGKDALGKLWEAFEDMEGMNLPQIRPEITGSALEVVPIAVFV